MSQINLPRELRDFSVRGTVAPKGDRLVARKLSRSDSAHVRDAMGRSGVAVRTASGRSLPVNVKAIAKRRTGAKVVIPVKGSVWAQMKAAFAKGRQGALAVPAGRGKRLLKIRGGK